MAPRDGTDKRIIECLKADSRKSFVEIGKELNLSESAVRRRINRLIGGGIISRFTVEVKEEDSTSAIVLVSVDSSTDTARVASKLAALDGVSTVYEITGQYDITAIIVAPNILGINSSIDALRKIPGVTDTNTVIILKRVK